MRLGLFTVLYPELDLESLVGMAQRLGCTALELSALPGRGLRHFDPVEIECSPSARERFQTVLKQKNMVISQLNCSCNPVSPDAEQARQAHEAFELAFRLAEKLGVHTVGSFSGCPAGCADDRTPNWITCPWPPEYLQMLKWQWEERLIPFWTWAAERAAQFGVTQLAIEMHPGFCVYNPETLLRLREAVGPSIGVNLDPSHLAWQSIDIPEAIRALKGTIWHVHAKDVHVDAANVRRNGVLDTKHYSHALERAWTFRTAGDGMTEQTWKQMIAALRLAGYDGTLSLEHEDLLLSRQEGAERAAAFLRRLIPQEQPEKLWWA